MKVWMLWHGGPSYAVGTVEDDIEPFDTLRAALDEFDRRTWCGGYYPAVEDSSALLYLRDPRGDDDPYPDRTVRQGARGGVVVDRA